MPEPEPKKEEGRHNEGFILKQFTDQITRRQIVIEHRMSRNKLIEVKGVRLNFDLSWKNSSVHLVKPISFDLKEDRDIQNKSATFFGYLDLLTDHARLNDYTFDLLIGKPQDESLKGAYEDALYVLDRAHAPKAIITEEKLEEYSAETAEILHGKDFERE